MELLHLSTRTQIRSLNERVKNLSYHNLLIWPKHVVLVGLLVFFRWPTRDLTLTFSFRLQYKINYTNTINQRTFDISSHDRLKSRNWKVIKVDGEK